MVGGSHSATKPTTSSRRWFTKSRNGCSQCKKRKVKCDEQAPCCGNCKKRGVICDFETSWPNAGAPCSSLSHTTSTSQTSVPFPTSLTKRLPSPCGALSLQSSAGYGACNFNQHVPLQELELMHHYATTVFLSLAADCDLYRPVWQVAVPQEAQSYQFLMRGILAISSLHLSHIWSSDDANYEKAESYKQMALNQCNSALVSFRSTINTITVSNVNAVFAFSHLLILFSFGSSKRSAKDRRMDDPIGDLLDLFVLLRGAMQIVREPWNWIELGPMGVLLKRGPPIMDRQYLPADAADALSCLERLCDFHLIDEERRMTHQSAIQQLCDSFVMAEMKRPDWSMALRFPMIFPDSLLACLRMREPMGLVILAHYCVILYRAPMRWWVADWSAQVIEAVFRSLDHDWREAISWPLKIISGRQPVSVDGGV